MLTTNVVYVLKQGSVRAVSLGHTAESSARCPWRPSRRACGMSTGARQSSGAGAPGAARRHGQAPHVGIGRNGTWKSRSYPIPTYFHPTHRSSGLAIQASSVGGPARSPGPDRSDAWPTLPCAWSPPSPTATPLTAGAIERDWRAVASHKPCALVWPIYGRRPTDRSLLMLCQSRVVLIRLARQSTS